MAITVSPNMNLPIPGVGTENGPDYAFDINASLSLLDAHDHSQGNGVQITPSGLNINTALTLNNNRLTSVAGITLQAQPSMAIAGTIYENGNDLYFIDGLGNNVRITQSGGVAGSPGSISNLVSPASASYVSASRTFVFQSDASIAANIDAASYILRNISPNSTYGLTLTPPTLTSDYTLQLPALPAANSFLSINTSGIIAGTIPLSGGITGSNIAANTVALNNIVTNLQIPMSVSSSTTVAVGTAVVICNSPTNYNLYSAVGNSGRQVIFKVPAANVFVAFYTINPTGGELIDGKSFYTMASPGEQVTLVSDGAGWVVIDHYAKTEPVSYTPTIQGWASVSGVNFKSFRDGKDLVIQGTFVGGGLTTNLASFTLGFLGSNLSVYTDPNVLGYLPSGNYVTTNAIGSGGSVLLVAGQPYAFFGQTYFNRQSGQPAPADTMGPNGIIITFNTRIPIQFWEP